MDTIIDLLDRAVAEHGPRPALIIKPGFRTRIWTYADIGHQVPRVAQVLRGAGVQPGDRVLIWAVNRPEWAIAFLGALWAEAVPVPVDVRSTDELATKIAAQTDAKLVLASIPTIKAASRLELPALTVESLVDVARDAQPLPRPTSGPGRPGRDRLHLRHHRGSEGRHAQPPQHHLERHLAAAAWCRWGRRPGCSRSCRCRTCTG